MKKLLALAFAAAFGLSLQASAVACPGMEDGKKSDSTVAEKDQDAPKDKDKDESKTTTAKKTEKKPAKKAAKKKEAGAKISKK